MEGEPCLKGTEAARALGYKNPRLAIRTHVEAEDKTGLEHFWVCISLAHTLTDPNAGASGYISESGLYSLIMSNTSHVIAFKRWVLQDVLPTIRRAGTFSTQPAIEKEKPAPPPYQHNQRRTRSSGRRDAHGCMPWCPPMAWPTLLASSPWARGTRGQ